jgi:hypothetical protein
MIVLINFADKGYINARQLQKDTALTIGNIDKVIEYSFDDIDDVFKERNKRILSHWRGAGYWIWKPYLILKTLLTLDDEDILVYCDSAISFVSSIYPYINALNGSFMLFSLCPNACVEAKFTKSDVFEKLKCLDNTNITSTQQLDASHSIWKKNENSINFLREWLALCEDYHLVTDDPSIEPNFPYFYDHRHDQSIMSCLGKLNKDKYNINIVGDSSECGNEHRDPKFPQLLWHHRNRS